MSQNEGLEGLPGTFPATGAATPKSAAPKLTAIERAVLDSLSDAGEERCYAFAPICQHTGLERSVVRRACRSLKRKGLARFETGLWTEDGEPRGSGYGLTRAGLTLYWNTVEAAR
jgi:hypothetical protein